MIRLIVSSLVFGLLNSAFLSAAEVLLAVGNDGKAA